MTFLLDVQGLSKSFDALPVANRISMSLVPGDRVALIGPNGAGKTTYINLVTGHLKPDEGRVFLDGQDLAKATPAQRVRLGLVRSFQVTRLFREMTAEEHVALAILQREGATGQLFGHYSRRPSVMSEVRDILYQLGLLEIASLKVGEIAYGQQRLLELAIALALKPKVLLLDEPAAGLPQSETHRIQRALETLLTELAVLMIDHDLDLVFQFAKRVIVLAAGTVIFDGSPQEVTRDQRVREAYLGNYANAGTVT